MDCWRPRPCVSVDQRRSLTDFELSLRRQNKQETSYHLMVKQLDEDCHRRRVFPREKATISPPQKHATAKYQAARHTRRTHKNFQTRDCDAIESNVSTVPHSCLPLSVHAASVGQAFFAFLAPHLTTAPPREKPEHARTLHSLYEVHVQKKQRYHLKELADLKHLIHPPDVIVSLVLNSSYLLAPPKG